MIQSILFFLLAGLCEIGGGYLVWLSLREDKSPWFALTGMVILGAYGIVPTLQPTHFARAYAAYGGVFIVLSLLWGMIVERIPPDNFDLLGCGIIVLGVLIIMYAPRP